ncbi:hypothetical protein LRAMOSA01272 [Lichtheimia ramosa]|uniref:RING-type E3 ubiquitin transferase n=1 Tax=Lichtheimia ramosa TaxID=688394 RepID=A0A077WJR2_9FUNG|nr:hypothetical protein LRAMOSA01272 [Lichtheimia ramosa]
MDSPDNAAFVQRQAMNRSTFYMFLFFFWLLTLNFSEDEAARRARPSIDTVIGALNDEKDSLGNVTFGVNVTHPLPSSVKEQVQQLQELKRPGAHYYHNITGVFRGDWQSDNVTLPDNEPSHNQTLLNEAWGEFQVEESGSFTFNVIKSVQSSNENINYVEGYMRLRDSDKADYGSLLLADGVHFRNDGSLYLVGASNRSISYSEDLLHMLPTDESMSQTRQVILEEIDKRIEELEELASWSDQGPEDMSFSSDFQCMFEMFIQLHPVPNDVKLLHLLEYERELENPQGISTIKAPPLKMSSVMYSPNCGVSIVSNDSDGTRIEKFYNKSIHYATMATLVALVQIFSLINQMEYTSTPSSVSNVSYWTIAMQAMMDGHLCLLHLTTGVVVESVFMPFAAAAFFNFILVSVFSMRYLLLIWRIQRPENTRPAPSTTATTEDNPNSNVNEQRTILPLATNRGRSMVSENDSPRDVSILYYRLYVLLLLGLFIFYQTAARSAFVQNIIIGTLGFAFYSFWVPQIIRNVLRGCRKPLSRRYVITMSITRLAIPLYFYGCPHNLIAHETSPLVWFLALYVGLQAFILYLQDVLGPRFFVSERFLPQTYNYHPIIPPSDEENASGVAAENGGALPRDCAICMLPVDTSGTGPPGLHVLGRAQYMLTPCQHLFHTECLEKWMRIKLECPVCRSYLPAS